MANLVKIPGSNALIRAGHYPSIKRANDKLIAAAGFGIRVLSAAETGDGISGGARSLSGANSAGSGVLSDHYEDNARGHAAVDIDNQRSFRNALGDVRFEQILASEGWRNIQINGAPFGSEPWHFARWAPEESVTTGSGGTLIYEQNGQDDMTDFLLYADRALGGTASTVTKGNGKGHVVEPEAMYYVQAPGAPAFPLTGGKPYTAHEGSKIAYGAFAADNPVSDSQKRFAASTVGVAQYVELYGLAAQPIATSAVNLAGVTVSADPELLKAQLKANELLTKLVNATLSLNPPDPK